MSHEEIQVTHGSIVVTRIGHRVAIEHDSHDGVATMHVSAVPGLIRALQEVYNRAPVLTEIRVA